MSDLPHRRYPCAECPFRRDTKPGQFPACRYDALRETVEHIGVRMAVLTGRLEPAQLRPGDDWPELFATYAEMAARQAAP